MNAPTPPYLSSTSVALPRDVRGMLAVLRIVASLLVLKTALSVILLWTRYAQPDFTTEFLKGREAYFFGAYQAAFYAHVFTGPGTLILGLVLVSRRFRIRFPKLHRFLGRIQAAWVLCLLTPSGLWMSWYADTGVAAATGFAVLAIGTGACVLRGWQCAVQRRFNAHQRWMWRCFLLLCSAVVLRLMGGMATVIGWDSPLLYAQAAWSSWLIPLGIFEYLEYRKRRRRSISIRMAS